MRGRVKLERKPPASFFLNFFLCFHAAPAGTLDLVDLPAGCGFFQRRLTSRCGLVTAPQRPCELARARAPIRPFPHFPRPKRPCAASTSRRRIPWTLSSNPTPPSPSTTGLRDSWPTNRETPTHEEELVCAPSNWFDFFLAPNFTPCGVFLVKTCECV